MTPEQALAVIEQERLDVLAEGMSAEDCEQTAAYVLASAYRRLQVTRSESERTHPDVRELYDELQRRDENLVTRVLNLRSAADKAWSMLAVYGVTMERAKSLGNGIDVLATRIRREEGFERMMHADAKRFRWIAANREKFKAMLADDHKTGDILSAELQEAMEGWNG